MRARSKNHPTQTEFWIGFVIATGIMFASGDLSAGLEAEVKKIVEKSKTGFKIARNTLYVIAAFGMLGVGAAAYFGRMNWKWAWHIIGGCALIGTSGLLIDLFFDTSEGGGGGEFDKTGFQ